MLGAPATEGEDGAGRGPNSLPLPMSARGCQVQCTRGVGAVGGSIPGAGSRSQSATLPSHLPLCLPTCWLCKVGGFLFALGFGFHVLEEERVTLRCCRICQAFGTVPDVYFMHLFWVSVVASALLRPSESICAGEVLCEECL